jgi:hypothetical protein
LTRELESVSKHVVFARGQNENEMAFTITYTGSKGSIVIEPVEGENELRVRVKGLGTVRELEWYMLSSSLNQVIPENGTFSVAEFFPGQQVEDAKIVYGYGEPAFDAATGGIDFTPDRIDLKIQGSQDGMRFKVDPTIFKQLQDAAGLTPVIINIRPITDLKRFLGVAQ